MTPRPLMFCYVCRREVHRMGWPSHVGMEKRKHGEDIYTRLRLQREGKNGQEPFTPKGPQRPLDAFGGGA